MPKKDINDLRRDRHAAAETMSEAAAALTALEDAETPPEQSAIDTAHATFEAAEDTFKRLDAQVRRREAADAAVEAAAISSEGTPGGAAPNAPATATRDEDRGMGAAMIVGALARAGRDGGRQAAADWLDTEGHSGLSAALSGAAPSSGGVLIPSPLAAEMIPLLRSRVVVRASGARSVPMPAGELLHGRQTGAASASYGAENSAAVESEPTFDGVQQNFRKLTGLVPVGNSLLRHSATALGSVVRDDLVAVMARTEDLAFLRFDGTLDRPTGIRWWAGTGQWAAAGVAANGDAAETALRGAVNRVEDSDVPMQTPGWIMRASAKNWLANLRDANGNKRFPSIEQSGTLLGYPIRTTSQVPDNLGVGGDETEIYFADFSEVVIGDAMVLRVAVSEEASFVDQGGNTVSAFQRDLTLMRTVSEHDLAAMHDVAISGFNGIGWSL